MLRGLIQLSPESSEADIRGKLGEVTRVKFPTVTDSEFVFLRAIRRKLSIPVTCDSFAYKQLKVVAGQGAIYVKLKPGFGSNCRIPRHFEAAPLKRLDTRIRSRKYHSSPSKLLGICDLSHENVPCGLPCLHGYPCVYRALAVRLARAIRAKKITSVRTAKAIRAKKIIVRAHGLGYTCKKNYRPCARLGLFVRKKFASVRTARAIRAKKNSIHSNSFGYPCEKYCHPSQRLEPSLQNSRGFQMSRLRLGRSGRNHATNLSKM